MTSTTTTPVTEDAERFLGHIERADADAAIDQALDLVREGWRVTGVVRDLLAPAQRTVGERWAAGRYTVAHEHLVSGVVDDVLGLLAVHAPRPGPEHTLALACAEGEWHTTPARMAALCLRDAGWRVQFLGGSLPADHLASTLAHLAPPAMAISCTLPLALPGVATLADAAHDQQIPVVVGGAAVAATRRHVRLGADGGVGTVEEAVDLLRTWLDQPVELQATARDVDADLERALLTSTRAHLLDHAYRRLEAELPQMAGYTERQRHHTRQDLDYILQFVDVALAVEDTSLLTSFVGWLADLLTARGVPPTVLERSLAVLRYVLPDEAPHARGLLQAGIEELRGRTG